MSVLYDLREPTTKGSVLPRWTYLHTFLAWAASKLSGSSKGIVTSMMVMEVMTRSERRQPSPQERLILVVCLAVCPCVLHNGIGQAIDHPVVPFDHCGHAVGAWVEDVGGGLQWEAAASAFVGRLVAGTPCSGRIPSLAWWIEFNSSKFRVVRLEMSPVMSSRRCRSALRVE